MIKLQVFQAKHGDCLLLKFGSINSPRHILIDGGPATIYQTHVRDELVKIRDDGGKLDIVLASHVDNDHIIGLIDLTNELIEQRVANQTETIKIDNIWHNAFNQSIGRGSDIESRLRSLFARTGLISRELEHTNLVISGVSKGYDFLLNASLLEIPINDGFSDGLISNDRSSRPINLGNFNLTIVGPTRKNLADLRKKWLKWMRRYERAPHNVSAMAMADRSIPNRSSIMVFVEGEGKRVLLTGDGRGDHLVQGLKQSNLFSSNGDIYVDILKLSHHGSDQNVTRNFFKKVIAKKYVISADGKYGNPDFSTLKWIVETAKEQDRTIEIIITNKTSATEKLLQEYNPRAFNYNLTILNPNAHSQIVEV